MLELIEGQLELCAVMTDVQGERRVIEACQQGDREAFRLLFVTYQDRVYSLALFYFSGDEATAKDLTQQVFLKLFTKIGQFRHDAQFTTWLFRLVTNLCIDEQRRRKPIIPFLEEFVMGRAKKEESQEVRCMHREINESVQAAIISLKPKLRWPVLLRYLECLSYEEIADVLGCSKGTVASRLNRAHKILARRLAHLA